MGYLVIPVTAYQQNCSLIWCGKTGKAALIDPGGDVDVLLAHLERQGVELEKVLLTHGHLDHVGGAGEIADRLGVPVVGPHKADEFWFDWLSQQAKMFGFPQPQTFKPDEWLTDGAVVPVGEIDLEVLHCPGHTPGHVVFYNRAHKLAFVGDVLFNGSVGRTDFPQGDYDTLIRSIREKLLALGDDVEFVPGHGPMSTMGKERISNPFIVS